MEKSVYANLVVPPASPGNLALLRLSVSAAHTDDEIDRIGDTLRFAVRQFQAYADCFSSVTIAVILRLANYQRVQTFS